MDKIDQINYITYVNNVPQAYKATQILGASTENKPNLLSNEKGARFLCYDSGDEFVWSGSAWVQIGASILTASEALETLIGDLTDLDTTEQGTVVGAINEVVGNVSGLSTDIGDLTTLETTEKGSIVGAINEIVV